MPSALRSLGRAFWITMALVVVVRGFVFVTYPTSVAGDGITYFRMMTRGTSSLMHAQGYPWLVTLALAGPRAVARAVGLLPEPTVPNVPEQTSPLREPPRPGPAPGAARPAPATAPSAREVAGLTDGGADADRERSIPALKGTLATAAGAFNHAVGVLGTAALFLLARAIWSPGLAVAAALFHGVNPWSLQWAAHTRPDQVLADLFLVVLALSCWAWRADSVPLKRWRYAALALALSLTLLVKFNALLLVTLPALLFVLDRLAWRERLRVAGAGAAVVGGVYLVFLVFHHAPSTGTFRLSYETCQVLWDRVGKVAPVLTDVEHGPATKKLAILRRLLPASYETGGAVVFPHLDAVPRELRRPYREQYLALVYTRDTAHLDAVWRDVRERPERGYQAVQYFLGLREADRLLCGVYFETLAARPWAFARASVGIFLEAFTQPRRAIVPVVDARLAYHPTLATLADRASYVPAGAGFVRFADPEFRSRSVTYHGQPRLWLPGVRAFTLALAATHVPMLALWLGAALGAVLWAWRPVAGSREPGLARWAPAVVLLALLLYFALWSQVMYLRTKDTRFTQPLLDTLFVLGVWRAVSLAAVLALGLLGRDRRAPV